MLYHSFPSHKPISSTSDDVGTLHTLHAHPTAKKHQTIHRFETSAQPQTLMQSPAFDSPSGPLLFLFRSGLLTPFGEHRGDTHLLAPKIKASGTFKFKPHAQIITQTYFSCFFRVSFLLPVSSGSTLFPRESLFRALSLRVGSYLARGRHKKRH